MYIKCSNCGHDNEDDRTLCEDCGNKLVKIDTPQSFQKKCINCGTLMPSNYQQCPHCNRVQVQPKHNKVTAGLLALFLGGLGIHKFYLGQGGQGILYLLFCWTYVPLILSFIEGIIILTMSDESFTQKYG